ncbi:putative intracellular protease/amidase [Chryseobacterium ginsenosidimutans]|nr:putative intracellular protease/amidase [Chryseobacterium ginsenosidimutans]
MLRRMDDDEVLKDKLKNTHKLSEVRSEDFDAVFYPGGHGLYGIWLKTNYPNSLSVIFIPVINL